MSSIKQRVYRPNSAPKKNVTMKNDPFPFNNEELQPFPKMPDLKDTFPELDAAKQEVKTHQNTLFIKSLEFDVVKNLDMERINDMLLNKNLLAYDTVKRVFDEEVELKIPQVRPEQFPDRQARKAMYAQNYLANRKDIYQKMKPVEVKALSELYEQKKRLISSSQIENKDRLYADYQVSYMEFLMMQPEIEYKRRQMILGISMRQFLDLAQCHEMLSALKNVPPFEHPALWNKKELSVNDSKFVEQFFKQKVQEITNKYDFKQEEFDFLNDKNDITFQVKNYFNTNLFANVK